MDLGFVWDENKYEQVQADHGVRFWEVVSAFEDALALEEPDPQGHVERFLMVAQTHEGRVLQVLYTETYTEEGAMLYRIITAFDAGKEWRDEYEQRKR